MSANYCELHHDQTVKQQGHCFHEVAGGVNRPYGKPKRVDVLQRCCWCEERSIETRYLEHGPFDPVNPQTLAAWRQARIDQHLSLSIRTCNVLDAMGFCLIGQLLRLTRAELEAGFVTAGNRTASLLSKRHLDELEEELARCGLKLKQPKKGKK